MKGTGPLLQCKSDAQNDLQNTNLDLEIVLLLLILSIEIKYVITK